jgi:hypothetical protein
VITPANRAGCRTGAELLRVVDTERVAIARFDWLAGQGILGDTEETV